MGVFKFCSKKSKNGKISVGVKNLGVKNLKSEKNLSGKIDHTFPDSFRALKNIFHLDNRAQLANSG